MLRRVFGRAGKVSGTEKMTTDFSCSGSRAGRLSAGDTGRAGLALASTVTENFSHWPHVKRGVKFNACIGLGATAGSF